MKIDFMSSSPSPVESGLSSVEERWRPLFENSALGVAIADPDGQILATNPAFPRLLDWTAQQIRQVRLRDLTGLSDLLGGRDVPEGAPLESQPFNIKVEKLHQRRDGTSIWLWIIVSMVPRTSPSDSCQLVLVEDITDWKRAEAALRQNEVQLRHELARERSLLSFLLDLNST